MYINSRLRAVLNYCYTDYAEAIRKNVISEDTKGLTAKEVRQWNNIFLYSMVYYLEAAHPLRNEGLTPIVARLEIEDFTRMFNCVFPNVRNYLLATVIHDCSEEVVENVNDTNTYQELYDRIIMFNTQYGDCELNEILLQMLIRIQTSPGGTDGQSYEIAYYTVLTDNETLFTLPFNFANIDDDSIEVMRNGVVLEFSPAMPSVNKYTIVMPNQIQFTNGAFPALTGEILRYKKTL